MKLLQEFFDDPLYRSVLTSKNQEAYDKAVDTLLSIRGPGALDTLKAALKECKGV